MAKYRMLAVCALVLFSCRPSDSHKIGCITPLTGEGSNYGRSTKQGIELAVSEINASKLLDRPLEVLFEDDRMTPREGVTALRKLVSANKVPLVLGPFGSSVVLACAPIANETHTVLLSASATADSIADAGDYIFRITPPNSKQGSDVAAFSRRRLNAGRAAIIYQNNDYGVSLRDAFATRFQELGGSVLLSEAVELNSTDLRAQIVKLQAISPEVVFFPLHLQEAGLLLKQADELGLKTSFVSADGAMTDDMLRIAGPAAEGTYYSTLALGYGTADKDIADFQTRFKAMYDGQEPDIYAAYYYEATKLAALALKNAGYEADRIKAYLYSVRGPNSHRGVTGLTSIDDNGEVDKPFLIYWVQGGKFARFEG